MYYFIHFFCIFAYIAISQYKNPVFMRVSGLKNVCKSVFKFAYICKKFAYIGVRQHFSTPKFKCMQIRKCILHTFKTLHKQKEGVFKPQNLTDKVQDLSPQSYNFHSNMPLIASKFAHLTA